MSHKYFKKSKKIIKPLLKGTFKKLAPEMRELLIMHRLFKKPSHGYDVIKYFKEDAPADLETKANRVYPSLDKMKKKGYLKQEVDKSKSKKNPRKVYSLTHEGQKHILQEINELKAALDSMQDYLGEIEKDVKKSS